MFQHLLVDLRAGRFGHSARVLFAGRPGRDHSGGRHYAPSECKRIDRNIDTQEGASLGVTMPAEAETQRLCRTYKRAKSILPREYDTERPARVLAIWDLIRDVRREFGSGADIDWVQLGPYDTRIGAMCVARFRDQRVRVGDMGVVEVFLCNHETNDRRPAEPEVLRSSVMETGGWEEGKNWSVRVWRRGHKIRTVFEANENDDWQSNAVAAAEVFSRVVCELAELQRQDKLPRWVPTEYLGTKNLGVMVDDVSRAIIGTDRDLLRAILLVLAMGPPLALFLVAIVVQTLSMESILRLTFSVPVAAGLLLALVPGLSAPRRKPFTWRFRGISAAYCLGLLALVNLVLF